jgi:hypothetical protein
MFLTPTELAELCGRKRSSSQIRWLAAQNLRFVLGADGRPRVLRAEVEGRLLSKRPAREPRVRVAVL